MLPSYCTGRILANTRPHQLCWNDREMGTLCQTTFDPRLKETRCFYLFATFTIITHKHTRCSTHQAARTSYAWVIFFASLLRNWPTARKFRSLISTNMFSSEFKTRPRGPEGGGAPFGACCTSSENIWRGNLAASEGE